MGKESYRLHQYHRVDVHWLSSLSKENMTDIRIFFCRCSRRSAVPNQYMSTPERVPIIRSERRRELLAHQISSLVNFTVGHYEFLTYPCVDFIKVAQAFAIKVQGSLLNKDVWSEPVPSAASRSIRCLKKKLVLLPLSEDWRRQFIFILS